MATNTRKEGMFYLTTHSTYFIYDYMASDIWLRTILIVRKETRCHHIGYFFRLGGRVLLYAPSHRQDSTYHGLCYTNRGALAGKRNSSYHGATSRSPPIHETAHLGLHVEPLLLHQHGEKVSYIHVIISQFGHNLKTKR